MNKKQIYILIAILGFLAVGVLLKTLQKPRGLVTEDSHDLNFSLDTGKAAKITVTRGGKEVISAVKQNKGWFLPGLWNARASDTGIQSFLNMLAHSRGELRSEDASLLGDFGILNQSAVGIKVLDASGKDLLDILVGTRRAGAGSDFVRRTGSNAVFFSDLNLERALGIYGDLAKDPIRPEIWADLEPLKFSQDDLRAVEVRRFDPAGPQTMIALKRNADAHASAPQAPPKLDVSAGGKEWGFAAKYSRFQIDAQKAESFLRALSSLRAQGVVDPLGSYGLDHPALEIKIDVEKPSPVVITLGAENADKTARYFQVSNDPSVYLLDKYAFEDFSSDDSKFFKRAFLGIVSENVEGITLLKQKIEKHLTAKDAAYRQVLERLQDLGIMGLLLTDGEKKLARSPGIDQMSIAQKGGKTLILDIGEHLEKDSSHGARYAASIRGEPVLFTISEADYDALFEAFKPASSPAKTAPFQPAQNKAQ